MSCMQVACLKWMCAALANRNPQSTEVTDRAQVFHWQYFIYHIQCTCRKGPHHDSVSLVCARRVYNIRNNANKGPKWPHIVHLSTVCHLCWRIDQGGHLVFPISPKKAQEFVEDVKIWLPVMFRWIPVSGFRGQVENVSANRRPGRPSWFSDLPEKNKIGRGPWKFASCQVSFNSIKRSVPEMRIWSIL